MNKYNLAGQKLAALAYNCAPEDVATSIGLVEGVDNFRNPNYGNLQRCMCKFAADALESAGKRNTITYEIFKAASAAPKWYPELDRFSDAVLNGLSRMRTMEKQAAHHFEREMIKEAAGAMALPIATNMVRNVPNAIKGIAGVGIAGGAGMGALAWLLNRHSHKDDADIEAMKAKAEYYKMLTNQIEEELGAEPNMEEVEQAVHDVF